jgi:hypothetical protein
MSLTYLGIMMPFGWNTTTLAGAVPTELYVGIAIDTSRLTEFRLTPFCLCSPPVGN